MTSRSVPLNPLVTFGGINSRGWVAGGQAGYNWQLAAGSRALKWTAARRRSGRSATPLVRTWARRLKFTNTASDDVQYLGTVRARVGGAVPFANTDVLLYGTAGLAWERVNRADRTILVVPPV